MRSDLMSDRGYAIFVTAAKYVFINLLATILWVILAQAGWIYSEETIVLIYLILNCTTLILDKQQKILDKLNEAKQENNHEK